MVESAADQLLDIMVIVFIGYIIYHIFRIWIDNKIADEQGEEVEAILVDEGGAASSASRLATLLPLCNQAMPSKSSPCAPQVLMLPLQLVAQPL